MLEADHRHLDKPELLGREWPASTPPCSSTSTGLVQPNSTIEAAMVDLRLTGCPRVALVRAQPGDRPVLDAGDRRILVPNGTLFSNSVVVHRATRAPEP